MSRQELDNICQPFYRGKSHCVEGHGIGMALVQSIINVHKGSLKIVSKEGYGTTFWLQL